MLAVFIVSCLVAGVGASCAAPYVPVHVALFERCGGMLLVAGLVLLGATLPA